MPRKTPTRRKKPTPAKTPTYRLPDLSEDQLDPAQRALLDSMRSGPRGAVKLQGPFGVYMHAPGFGELVQKLGAHARYNPKVPARLSEFAIMVTARLWRAQYEWYAHVPHAEKAGVSAQTIKDIKAGRRPARAGKDALALYDFIHELYKTRRVSDRTYARVHAILGDGGMVEFVGILGYYALVAMTLNVFRVPLPEGAAPAFAEPK
jgi:4-carboxymuconolactone decarboxylase